MDWNPREYPSNAGRREFLRYVGLAGAAAAFAACAPSTPEPGAGGSGSSVVGVPGAKWQAQWDETIALAKKEGTLSVVTPTGTAMRKVIDIFQEQFPWLKVEHTPARTSDFVNKSSKEQQGGVYSYDISVVSMASVIKVLKPTAGVVPLKSVLFRDDVVQDSNWIDSFEAGFWDLDKNLFYAGGIEAAPRIWVNSEFVKPDEVKGGTKDLLNPKFKGKIGLMDPRTEGAGYLSVSAARYSLGKSVADPMLTELFQKQEPMIFTNDRVYTEALVRGTQPIAISPYDNVLQDFWEKGIGKAVVPVQTEEWVYAQDPNSPMWLVAKQPHPNAAKLFANWYLTKDAQTLVSKETLGNSRRADVPPINPANVPVKGKKYFYSQKEESLDFIDDTIAFMKKVVKA